MNSEASDALTRRYVLAKQLGAGGMGVVYAASDRLTRHKVALKRVLTSAVSAQSLSEERRRKLRLSLAREFQILSSLRHPNIISVLDYGFDLERQPYFTMNLLEAPRTILEEAQSQSLERKIELLIQVLQALRYLHRRGILHRDLKPANVLVEDGQVKLLDFGISKPREEATTLAGSLPYMAPEVLQQQPAGERSDLYAVGVIAFEMLAGRHPFQARDRAGLVRAVLSEPVDLSSFSTERRVNVDPSGSGGTDEATRLDRTRTAFHSLEETTQLGEDPAIDAPTLTDAKTLSDPGESAQDGMPWQDERDGRGQQGSTPADLEASLAAAGSDDSASLMEVGSVVATLLAKRPEDRFADAGAVIQALSRLLEEPVEWETAATRESFLQAASFVGRDAEMEQLGRALREARRGQGQTILVGGESGVGKSRLIDEFRSVCLVEGCLVLHGQGVSNASLTFQHWREPLRHLCCLTRISPREASVLKPLVPDISHLVGNQVEDAPRLDVGATQQRLLDTIESLFRRQQRPVLLILEDIHWINEGMDVLQRLARLASQLPLLILATYRDDESPKTPDTIPQASRLKLERLSPQSIVALSESMLGEIQPELEEFLTRHTEGNTYFLVEVVRALAEEAGRLDKIGAIDLPEEITSGGIESFVMRRLSRAPREALPYLEFAAVLGRGLELSVLEQFDSGFAWEEWLSTCASSAILEVHDNRWRFSHDKLREGILRKLPPEKRTGLHRSVATAIEGAYPEQPDQVVRLAYHWGAAGDVRKEGIYSVRSGQQTYDSGAYSKAVVFLERALAIHDAHPRLAIDRAAVEHLLGETFFGLGKMTQSRDHLENSAGLLGGPVPASTPAQLRILVSQLLIQTAHRLWPARFVGRSEEGDRGRWKTLSRIYERLGHVHYHRGDTGRMLSASLANINSAERAGPSAELARSYATQIVGVGLVPIHSLAETYAELAQKTLEPIDDPGVIAWSRLLLSVYSLGVGRWELTREASRQAQGIYAEIGDRRRWEESAVILGYALLFSGKREEADQTMRELISVALKTEDEQAQCWALGGQAELCLLREESAEAIAMLERALSLCEGKGWVEESWMAGVLSRARLQHGDFAQAWSSARRALNLLAEVTPTAAYTLSGYTGVVEVCLAALEAAGGRNRSDPGRDLHKVLKTLRKFSRVFPIGRPALHRLEGRHLWSRGKLARARKSWESGLEESRRLEMPYEEKLLHAELTRRAT